MWDWSCFGPKKVSPLKTAIYKFVKRKEYKEELMGGQLFQKLISEIRETPCEDGTGYYHSDSREQLTHENLEQLEKIRGTIIKELSTKNMAERFQVVFRFCELYQSWALVKKSQQAEDITRKEIFETHPDLPLKITN